MCNLPDETPGIIFARLDNLGARFDQLEKLPLSFARQANKGAAGVQYLSLDHAAKMIGKTKPTLQRALRREAALPRGIRFLGAESGQRVRLIFDNSDGRAVRLIDQHRNGGVEVNSAKFFAAFQEIKGIISRHGRRGKPNKLYT